MVGGQTPAPEGVESLVASAMLAAVSACASFMGPAPIVSRRHMSKIAMDEATRDPEPSTGKAVYDANAGW